MHKGLILIVSLLLWACTGRSVTEHAAETDLHLPAMAVVTPRQSTSTTDIVEPELVAPPKTPAQAISPTMLINLIVHEAPVQEVLFTLARESGLNMDVHPGLQGKVTLHAMQQSIPAILARIAKQVDMHYEWSAGVWLVAPDTPVIRTYRLNYVNMTRDTSGFIGAASEISGGGRAVTASGNAGVTGASGTGGLTNTNSSRTAVASQARYHLWESVVQNLQALLEETDKATIVQRYGVTASPLAMTESADSHPQAMPRLPESAPDAEQKPYASEPARPESREDKEQQRQEYTRWMGSRLIANPETGVLAVRATHRQHQQVKAYLESVMQIAARQVLIEATIVEVELTNSFQMGIDWSRLSASAQQHGWMFSQSLGSQAAQRNPVTGKLEANNSKNALGQNNDSVALVLGYLNPLSHLGNLSASVTLLEQFGKAKVLSSPKLMVLNNQTAILKVVDNLVYFTIQSQISQSSSTNGANLQSITTTANTVPVGLVMAVTAQINSQKRVNLNVRPTVSRVLRYVEDPNPQLGSGNSRIASSIPEIQVREIESVLNVESGNVAVLGGLMQEDGRSLNDRVPGLASLPLIGYVFKGQNQGSRKTELVVFIRPTVIEHADVHAGQLQPFASLLPEHVPATEDMLTQDHQVRQTP